MSLPSSRLLPEGPFPGLGLVDGADGLPEKCCILGSKQSCGGVRKTRQHDQRQIDRAVRAQQACEREHRRPAEQTYERQA